ncbi:hypothetical protein FH581_008075 [Leptospira weilii]|uniref:hypothetical protein n=1 Tax=Leptospira weilii TaxID=28184 RepID=UPI0012FE64D4|nr:hypothetical protein [Leptospira weilii]UPY78804.1 hypothetical protein FH581_008075 [Leptospira weilii]
MIRQIKVILLFLIVTCIFCGLTKEQIKELQSKLLIKQEGENVFFCFHRPDIEMDIREIEVNQIGIRPAKEIWKVRFPEKPLELNCVKYGDSFPIGVVKTQPSKLQKGKSYYAQITPVDTDLQSIPRGKFVKE